VKRVNGHDPRIHVVQATFGMGVGGMERVIMDLCRYVDPERFRFTICCLSVRGPLADQMEAEGVPVVYCANQTRMGKYLRGFELAQLFREQRVDVLHTHNTTAFIDGLVGAQLARVPVRIHTDHCKNYPDEKFLWMALENVASRFIDKMVAVSDHTRGELMQYERIPASKLMVIHNGINPQPATNRSIAEIRAEFGFSGEHRIIGTVGRLQPQKGLDMLVAAAPAVLAACPDVRFLVVGGGSLEQELTQQAAALGLEGRVIFTGWRSDAIDLMRTFDCFVSTSNFEGLPMVLLEAMAAAKPIVATAVGGVPEAVEDGFNGITLHTREPEALSSVLIRLAQSPETLQRFGANARARYQERFTAQAMASAYTRLYDEFLEQKGLRAA
jgi:glycosyltransferase involved in cell wall biosynthesis